MLDTELGGPLTAGDVLLAAAPHWDRISYLMLGDELGISAADADTEIGLLHQRIQNLGLGGASRTEEISGQSSGKFLNSHLLLREALIG